MLLKELAFVKFQLQGSVLGTLLQEKCDFDSRSTEESSIEAEGLWKGADREELGKRNLNKGLICMS